MTYREHLRIVKLMAERDCYRECLDKLRSAVMGRDVTVRGMGDKQLHEATDEAVDAVRTRLMPEGYEWSDGFAGAVDFFEAMHDLLYTIDGEEHTGPEMVRDVMARLMPEGCEAHGVVGTMLEYRRVLNGVCKRLGLTDGTGKPEQDGVIYGELEKRLMPEGMEWPRYEDGETFIPGDDRSVEFFVDGIFSVWINDDHQHLGPGKRVKRPQVLAADDERRELARRASRHREEARRDRWFARRYGDPFSEVMAEKHERKAFELERAAMEIVGGAANGD